MKDSYERKKLQRQMKSCFIPNIFVLFFRVYNWADMKYSANIGIVL